MMNESLKEWLDELVLKADQQYSKKHKTRVWGRTNEEFLELSKIEYLSHRKMSEEDVIDEMIPNDNRIQVNFRIITDKWNNSYVPYVTKESIILSPDEWRDVKLKVLI